MLFKDTEEQGPITAEYIHSDNAVFSVTFGVFFDIGIHLTSLFFQGLDGWREDTYQPVLLAFGFCKGRSFVKKWIV